MVSIVLRRLDQPILNPFHRSKEDEVSPGDDTPKRAANNEIDEHDAQQAMPHKYLGPDAKADNVADIRVVPAGFQDGVRKAEAITLTWTPTALHCTYAWNFVAYFVIAFQSAICSPLTKFAYADFNASNLVSVSSVLASIIRGVFRLPTAKFLDSWGRPECLMVMIAVQTLGLIFYATSESVTHYTAAVMYGVGYTGVYYILGVFVFDRSQLIIRRLMLAISQLPFICTSFTARLAVESILGDALW